SPAFRQESDQGLEIAAEDIFLPHVFPEPAQSLALQLAIVRGGDHETGIDGPDRGAAMDVELATALSGREYRTDIMDDCGFIGRSGAASREDEGEFFGFGMGQSV